MKILLSQNQARVSDSLRNTLAFLFLLAILSITYANSFEASWHLDDEPNILENSRLHMNSFSWSRVKEALISAPSSHGLSFYRPVSRLSLALNYYFGRDQVFGYHVLNLVIHLFASFFLYLFVLNTLKLPLLKDQYGSHSFSIALLAAIFWSVHPIHTQAVTYVVQRMTSLAGMFTIMAMYFYVRSRLASGKPARIIHVVLSAVAGLLALGSKENAILLPASLFLFHVLLVAAPRGETLARNLRLFSLLYLLPLLAGLAYLQISHDAIARVFDLYEARTFTMPERLLTEARVVVLYVSLLLYPMPGRLSADHDIDLSTSLFDPWSTLPSILLILVVLLAACIYAKKMPLVSFSLLFYFLNHSVESTILPMELVFEHRNYLPSLFFFVPISAGLVKIFLFFLNKRSMQMMIALSVILILMGFGHSTFVRNSVWKDEKSLWEDVLEKYPRSFRAHNNLGRYYTLHEDLEKASLEFQQALEGPQTHSRLEKAITFFNIGYIAQIKGEVQKALLFYSDALALDPCCPRANNNLAVLLLQAGASDSSRILRLLKKALECGHEAELPSARSNMAIMLKNNDSD